MVWLRRFILRVYNLLAPGRAERHLTREVAAHLALLEERFRAGGLTPEEARMAARRAFGGIEQAKEQQRDARSFPWIEDARRDLAYAVRTLIAAPGFTFVAVFTLALGIGSVAIIYSVIHNVLFDPLPYPDSHRFVNVFVVDRESGRAVRGAFPADEFFDYQEGSRAFEGVVGTRGANVMLAAGGGAESLRGVWVTPNFFEFMGLPALVGRTAGPEDARPDAPPVAVLRHRAWLAYFGADPGIIGKTIIVDSEPRTVIGIMPPRFTWHAADVWLPKPFERGGPDGDTARNFQARLKPGVTLEEAAAQLNVIAARRARERPGEYPEQFRMHVVNVIEYTVGGFSTVLYIALAAVGLLLLIACCNVANMLLARATAREREMTVRAALGAGRGRIVRQLLVESLLLAGVGAGAGWLLAYIGLDALIAWLPPAPLPGEVEIALDRAALGVALGSAFVSALLFGIAPALYSARRDIVESLKGSGQGTAGGRRSLFRHGLVMAEIALSLVLLFGAALMLRTFVSLVRVDLGFDPARVVFVPVAFPRGAYATPAEKHGFYVRVMQRIAALPGVEAVSASTFIPPDYGPPRTQVERVGTPAPRLTAVVQSCTEGCFRTLGIRILRGRGLHDVAADDVAREAVVNQTFAKHVGDTDPVGRHFRITSPGAPAQLVEVVGIVEDVKNQGIRGATVPQVYLPGATAGRANPVMLVRVQTEPLSVVHAIRREIALVDSRVALVQPRTIQEIVERFTYAQPRFTLIVLGLFAAAATLLVAVGVFSVMAYTVSRRRKEIALRTALGATRAQVLGVIFGLGIRLIVVGTAIGGLASVATSRLIATQLWNTSPHDPLTLGAVIAAIAIVTLAACYVPARRAMAIEPMVALRNE